MKTKTPLEKIVEKQCLAYLNTHGWFAWKVDSTGAVVDGRFIKRQGRFNLRGISDAVAIRLGRVVFLEFKRIGGVQSREQKAFQNAVERHGGTYWLVHSLDELKEREHEWKGNGRSTDDGSGIL